MAKTLKNGLSMIKTNPLNHNWSHFAILLGLTLHQFKKKLLLNGWSLSPLKSHNFKSQTQENNKACLFEEMHQYLLNKSHL